MRFESISNNYPYAEIHLQLQKGFERRGTDGTVLDETIERCPDILLGMSFVTSLLLDFPSFVLLNHWREPYTVMSECVG